MQKKLISVEMKSRIAAVNNLFGIRQIFRSRAVNKQFKLKCVRRLWSQL